MSYEPVLTDDGLEIRDADGNLVAGPTDTIPPRDPDTLQQLFDDANVSQPMKRLLKVLFGVKDVKDERSDTS